MNDKPFKSARAALAFALQFDGRQFATSSLGRLAQAGAIGSGAGLHGVDGAAMAGMLRRRLEALQKPNEAALVALNTPSNSAAWLFSVAQVTEFMRANLAGRPVRDEVLVAAIRKYFGARLVDRQIADALNLSRETVARQSLLIRPDLKRIEAAAWAEWESSIRDACMI
jgi:hypothetical protein